MTLLHTDPLTGSEIHRGDAHEVAAGLEPGSFSLAVVDPPYGLRKAAWDMMKVTDLPAFLAPHLDDVGRLCADSATLYIWNTAEGWAALHPGIVGRGWTFRSLIVWDKGLGFMAGKCDVEGLRSWYDVTEVCGMYQREAWAPLTCAGQEIAYAAGADERNWIRPWLGDEWKAAGLRFRQADEALGTNGMAGHYFQPSQWSLPTWDAYRTLAAYAAEHGPPRARPYLVLPKVWPDGGLRASYDHLRAEYDHLRAEYEASRPAFNCPLGVSNVWTTPLVGGRERLAGNGATLHPCQKPLAFAERILRASSRPGSSIWVPFCGTARESVAAQRMARRDPAEARRVVCADIDQDGRDYLGAVVAQLGGEDTRERGGGQQVLL